jgi:hypothetical protein
MSLDFGDAASRSSDTLIPKNTIARLVMSLRPGGHGDGGWLRMSNKGNALMLDGEFTVVEGPYAKRKFWTLFTVEGETEGHKIAVDISRSNIRAILESARNVKPSDMSPDAAAKRRIESWGDLDGLEFIGVIGIEEDKKGEYGDKNRLSAAVTPDRKEYKQFAKNSLALSAASGDIPFFEKKLDQNPLPSAGKPPWAR